MDTKAYLERIGYRGTLRPTLPLLRRLHIRHMLSVPFENLDIHLGQPIILDPKRFYEKIAEERRGGYCYELNGCFAWLLRSLGFRVTMLSARVARRDGSFTPDFDHMALLVRVGERWLVDVGFGDSFREPKQLDNPGAQADDGRLYQVVKENQTRVLKRWEEEGSSWRAQYSFNLKPRKLSDFAPRNRYQQTSPRSHFTRGPMISKLTPTGRITLTGTRFIVIRNKKRKAYQVRNNREFSNLLAKHFQLRLRKRKVAAVGPPLETSR